ncbi:hypothetical protein EL22_16980 [Halostagnicola sp. A56]|uniref:hypothetical protein n=1 Tax=Halostagnicola sp. A56 TaxID=1495067 RepID=UPI00049F643C|nr:hypothetical protein [Halostagnicola sp. A56]KDE59820.1 hypothetical protein EL22_16980 [Halostagnicola sp. A56]
MADKISRERAKELIDEHQAGRIIVTDIEPKPTIGTVPEDERELEGELEAYRFGELGVDDD